MDKNIILKMEKEYQLKQGINIKYLVKKSKSKSPRRRSRSKSPGRRSKSKSPRRRSRSKSPRRRSRSKSPRRRSRSKSRSGNCIKRSNMPLRDIQTKVVKYINKLDKHGLLVVHGPGSGKTLTAVTASQCFLDANQNGKIIFVGPASLLKNFEKELVAYGEENFSRYEFYSFDKFMNKMKAGTPVNCKKTMLIIDEAHNLRNYMQSHNKLSKKYLAVLNCAKIANKRLLLTATPLVNNLMDFIPLINFVYGYPIIGNHREYIEEKVKYYIDKKWDEDNVRTITKLLRKKIDFVTEQSKEDFPAVKEMFVNVRMTRSYQRKYDSLLEGTKYEDIFFKNPGKFYNAHRRAVNKAGEEYYSYKLKKMIPIIEKGKTLIYTNWIEFGIEPIVKFLRKNNISYGKFYGRMTKNEKAKIVKEFNENKKQVLIITKAGGEGIDLKGVRNVIVLDPVWHDAGLKQIIGRAVRYKSHAHLPKKDRRVNVFKMVLVEPDLKNWQKDEATNSGDVLLYRIIDKKKILNKKVNVLLKKLSI